MTLEAKANRSVRLIEELGAMLKNSGTIDRSEIKLLNSHIWQVRQIHREILKEQTGFEYSGLIEHQTAELTTPSNIPKHTRHLKRRKPAPSEGIADLAVFRST